MKGGLAAMLAAALAFVARRGGNFGGRLSFLVTGDEEGPAVNGTVKLSKWAARRGERFSAALVGEPTSARRTRRPDQDRPARQLLRDDLRGRTAGPRRLSAYGGQSGARADATPLCAAGERRSTPAASISAVDPGGRERRRGQPGLERHSGVATARLNSRYNDCWTRAQPQAGNRAAPRRGGGRSDALRPNAGPLAARCRSRRAATCTSPATTH